LTYQGANKKKNALFGSLSATLKDFRSPPGLLFRVATDLYESLNTPVSLSCEILLRYNEHEQLVKKTVTPEDFIDFESFRDSYQAVSFLRKAPIEIPGVDPLATAKEKFFASEEACRESNARFRSFVRSGKTDSPSTTAVILAAAEEIHRILGSSVDPREWLYACRFGPGAFNHTDVRGLTSLYDKLQVRPSVSKDMADLGALLVMSQPQWARSVTDSEIEGFWPLINEKDLDLVPGNRVAFVPKTAVTHRTIAIEPLLNVYAQLGLGKMIRRRLLRKVGLDLNDQTPNQELARKGSIDGTLATIDLSNASDTVARELVRFMVPPKWFHAMDTTRCKVGFLDGKWLRYEKFSSMGNGFTFELETLIFLGIALACVRHLDLDDSYVRVYGDDIIVPVGAYDLLEKTLTFCGFSVNSAKSFKDGVFRESCGKDYYDGYDVRPFLQKENLYEIQDLFRLANGIRGVAHRRNSHYGCDLRLHKPWRTVLHAIPRSVALHCRVPCHAGDSDGIKSNWDESQTSSFVISNYNGWEGVSGLRFQSTPLQVRHPTNMLGVIAEMLYRLKDGDTVTSSGSVPPRTGRDFEYRLKSRAFYGPWTNFGDWV